MISNLLVNKMFCYYSYVTIVPLIAAICIYVFKNIYKNKLLYGGSWFIYYCAMLQIYLLSTRHLVNSHIEHLCPSQISTFYDGYIGSVPVYCILIFIFSVALIKFINNSVKMFAKFNKFSLILSILSFSTCLIINKAFLKVSLLDFIITISFVLFISLTAIIFGIFKRFKLARL